MNAFLAPSDSTYQYRKHRLLSVRRTIVLPLFLPQEIRAQRILSTCLSIASIIFNDYCTVIICLFLSHRVRKMKTLLMEIQETTSSQHMLMSDLIRVKDFCTDPSPGEVVSRVNLSSLGLAACVQISRAGFSFRGHHEISQLHSSQDRTGPAGSGVRSVVRENASVTDAWAHKVTWALIPHFVLQVGVLNVDDTHHLLYTSHSTTRLILAEEQVYSPGNLCLFLRHYCD
jgi:hypothetical protein